MIIGNSILLLCQLDMKKYVGLFFFFLYSSPCFTQSKILTIKKACNYYSNSTANSSGKEVNKINCNDSFNIEFSEMSSDEKIKKIFYDVTEKLGIAKKVFLGSYSQFGGYGIYFKDNEENLARILIESKKISTKWVALGIIFHELGHYINDHENLCSNKELELDADYFSGYCLSIADANINEALESINSLPDAGDDTHPPKAERIKKIILGWNSQKRMSGITSFTSINPTVLMKKSKGETIISINDVSYVIPTLNSLYVGKGIVYDSQFGLLYIDSINSTYQIFNPKKEYSKGFLVNDKTSIVYQRYNSKYWRAYNKGIIIYNEQVTNAEYIKDGERKGIDFKINYLGNVIIFPNYLYSPYQIMQPAFYR